MSFKTLEETYTREQLLKINLVYLTYEDFGYTNVVFINPYGLRKQITVSKEGEFIEYFYDLKAFYLLQIWKQAKKNTDDKFFFWDHVEWYYDPDSYYQELVFFDYNRHCEAVKFFWSELERIADSQTIFVEELYEEIGNTKKWILNSIGNKRKIELDENNRIINTIKRTWKWPDIKEFFIELTHDELKFLHGKNLNQCTIKDLSLFEACKHTSLSEIKNAIQNGASVNAFDKNGDGCISNLFNSDFLYDEFENIPEDEEIPEECIQEYISKIKEIVLFLLEKGLNINLYGYAGQDTILSAHWLGIPELLEFLIEHGAKVNQNSIVGVLNPGDFYSYFIQNGAYGFIEKDLGLPDYDHETLSKEESILERHGVKYWIDGWDEDKISDLNDKEKGKLIYN